ncbi:PspA/IM30 family protein [Paenibacillus crassostreae]|uniref:Phage shock protein A n=1 Tax=Paenibacillus crassostreae TaxID=1763538 RepID=A0A167GCD8_9BACL|nr:PspA/IM30 family protein [Paenibacillus crassostreae]AOZ92670.1 phage shock protein A [Paenibacillus crassostreae]OAB77439.1 phage shock protein A [Paenibacillus crassostreae]
MGILSRFRDIMASNVNALLDKAEDPEKMMNDYMRNLNMDLGKVKAETASVLSDESRAQRTLDECTAEIRKLQRYAEKSVDSGNDEDALKFLERKAKQIEKQKQLQTAYDVASANALRMQQMQEKIILDMGQLEARQLRLKERMAATKAQQKINSSGSSVDSDPVLDTLEEKVDQAYNEAMALAELRAEPKDDLDDLFAELEKSTNAQTNPSKNPEDELAAMKDQMNNKN